jgi:hypothetical protein
LADVVESHSPIWQDVLWRLGQRREIAGAHEAYALQPARPVTPLAALGCMPRPSHEPHPYFAELLLVLVVLCFARLRWMDHRPKSRPVLRAVAIACAAIVQVVMVLQVADGIWWAKIEDSTRVAIWAGMGLALCLLFEVLANDRSYRMPPAIAMWGRQRR